jgi:hypothetical protein
LRPPFGTSRFTSATWLHFGAAHLSGRAAADWRDGVRQTLEAEVELVFTSPRMIDGQPPVHHSVLVLAPDAAARGRAERAVFDSLGIKLACPPSESLG